ncbi:hypothetical protein SLS55_001695 [Diplodia seriata]|uniref:Uncharacterized protein n=1 Tax=Diplodia seriata TaxID=420778 RepID=A0ABR3CQ06_9PEZI
MGRASSSRRRRTHRRDRVGQRNLDQNKTGTKAYLCHYDGVNTITIEDGGQPMFIHRELSELRRDILMKCPPREFTFPAGWRPCVTQVLLASAK